MEKKKWITFSEGNLKDITLHATDSFVKSFEGGNTDKEMMSDINSNFPIGKVIIDVGAFVGSSSLVFAKMVGKTGRVVSFEPNPYNRERITENLPKNPDLAEIITVYPFALGTQPGKLGMNISASIDTGHSSTSRMSGAHAKISNNLLPEGFFENEVEVIRLDDFVEENSIVPNIIKVDIEGAEHLMLGGALETLKKYHPVVYMEIHSEYCAITCYKIFSDLNYLISIIHEEEDNRLMIKATYNGLGAKVAHFADKVKRKIENIDSK